MLFVFIDTNILLRFYAYSDDALIEIEKLTALAKANKVRLLVTQQVIDEHARNRDKEVIETLKRLDQIPTSVQLPRFADHHNASQKLLAIMKEVKSLKTELLNAVRVDLSGDGLRADRLIENIFASSPPLIRDTEVIDAAKIRHSLKNPPGKQDSIGDQINWEILLRDVAPGNDLHVVSRDGDFKGGTLDNVASYFLRSEWASKKNAKLYVYSGLAEFTKTHFPEIKLPSDALKSAAIEKFISSKSYQQTHAAVVGLLEVRTELNSEEAVAILTAATLNSQISGIIEDDDVFALLRGLHTEFYFETPVSLDTSLAKLSPKFSMVGGSSA